MVAPFVGTLIDDLGYAEYSNGYLNLPTSDYSIQIRNESGTDVVAQYSAPLQTLGLNGQALVVVASGFLDPANNSGGESFGLWVALPSGGNLVELPATSITTARIQAIHNCADAAASSVDVWINSGPTGLVKLIDNFAFRTASPFVDAPAGTPLRVVICPPSSTDTSSAIIGFDYNLAGGSKYVLTASGIVSPTGYSPSPAFTLEVFASAREIATNSSNTDVLVFHGSTDAPTVDVVAVGAGTIVDNLSYPQYNATGYLELPTSDYQLNITDELGTTIVASYQAPLSTLGLSGEALVVVASGFLNPANNSGGESFGLWVALPSGGNLIELPSVTTNVSELIELGNVEIFPNPFKDIITVNGLESNGLFTLYDISGKKILEVWLNDMNQISTENIMEGSYIYEIQLDNKLFSGKLIK